MAPLQFVGRLGEVDVEATVSGGGGTGQSGAIRLALSKALASFVDADTREKMRIGKQTFIITAHVWQQHR